MRWKQVKDVLRRIYHIPRDIKRRQLAKTVEVNEHPIFMLGNQKSGTSAIAALLADLTGVSVTIDIPGICEPVQPRLHNNKLSFAKFVAANKYDFSKDIIKEPSLTFLYNELMPHFPEGKVVFIIRHPVDNIRSILNRLNLPGDLDQLGKKELKKLRSAPYDWTRVVDGRWLGIECHNYIEQLAERWNLAADIYLKHSENMVLMRYEDFRADKIGELSLLAEKLGLEPTHDIEDKVNIQYQPAGKNVDKIDFFGEDNLARIENICAERMKSFSYD